MHPCIDVQRYHKLQAATAASVCVVYFGKIRVELWLASISMLDTFVTCVLCIYSSYGWLDFKAPIHQSKPSRPCCVVRL